MHRPGFGTVASNGAGTMWINVPDLLRLQPCGLDRQGHRPCDPPAFGIGIGQIVGVSGSTYTGYLGVWDHTSALYGLGGLQDHYGGPFSDHEPCVVLIVGAASPLRIVVADTHRPHRHEPGYHEWRYHGLGGPTQDHIRLTPADQVVPHAYSVRAAGAGQGRGYRRSSDAELEADSGGT